MSSDPRLSEELHEAAPPNVGRQVIWNYAAFAVSKCTTLIMTVVLARLLGPAEFGQFALALLVLTLFDFVSDLGVGGALVRQPGRWTSIAPTGLTLSVGLGVLMGATAILSAPVAAHLLGNDDLTPLVQVLGLSLAVSAWGTIPQSWMRRQIDFRARVLPEFFGSLSKCVLAIGLAAAGFGVWSLVWAQLAASIVTTVGYWITARPGLRFGFNRVIAESLLRFGLPITLVSLLSFGVYNVDYVAIGRRLGSVDLGYYTLAYRLPELAVLNLCVVVGDVLFSALSRLQDDRPALIAKYLATVRVVVTLTSMIGFGIAAFAHDVVALLYGAEFAPAADVLAVLAVYTVMYSVNFHSGDAYKATGRPGLLATLNAVKLVLLAPAIWWAAGYSILTAAVTMVVVEVVVGTIRLLAVRKVLGVKLREHWAVLWAPVTAAAIPAIVFWEFGRLLPAWPSAVRLIILAPPALGMYAAALWLLAPDLFKAGLEVVRRRRLAIDGG